MRSVIDRGRPLIALLRLDNLRSFGQMVRRFGIL